MMSNAVALVTNQKNHLSFKMQLFLWTECGGEEEEDYDDDYGGDNNNNNNNKATAVKDLNQTN
jgi:hypothetical protein